MSLGILFLAPKNDKWYVSTQKYSAGVKEERSLEKQCRGSVTFSFLCCHLFQFFRAAAS